MDEERAAHMPARYLKPERPKVKDLLAGTTTYINFTAVAVDLNGATYVDQDAKTYEERSFETVKVKVAKNGCILALPKNPLVPLTFTPRRLHSPDSYVPVLEIIEEE
jgi:hypothetical protein